MKGKYDLTINWQIEIPSSHVLNNRGSFSLLKNHSTLLAYNETDENGHPTMGRLVKLTQGKIDNIFNTNRPLSSFVLDGKDIYLVSLGKFTATRVLEKAVLFKISDYGVLKWTYQLMGTTGKVPVVYHDSIFIVDAMPLNGKGNLYRLNKNGELLFKKPLEARASFEPYIFKDKEEILLCCGRLRELEILDFEGNVKKQKDINQTGSILFSQNEQEELFAAIDDSIVALDNELNVLWAYKPALGFAHEAPVFDSKGNSYSLLNMKRLVSLDHNGNERWMVHVSGHGRQALIIEDDIMIITSRPNENEPETELSDSRIEIFTKNGEKLQEHLLPGSYVNAIKDNDTLFVITNSIVANPPNNSVCYSVKIFSLRLH